MLSNWIAAARPKTLPAAVVPIMVGAAESYRWGVFDAWPVAICLVFSLLVQIGTNMANDYYDHIRGADTDDRLGPERLVASGKIAPRRMLIASLLVFVAAFAIGLNLVAYRGWELLAVGVISIVFGYGYTGGPFPLAYKGLGDVFVVIFFGLVATAGTVYVIAGTVSFGSLLLGLALGLLANNILVVNNYRDRDTDRRVGKMTLIARFGPSFGIGQYWVQLLLAYGLIAAFAVRVQSWWPMLAWLTVPLACKLAFSLPQTQGKALNGVLAKTAALLLGSGILLALGVVLSKA